MVGPGSPKSSTVDQIAETSEGRKGAQLSRAHLATFGGTFLRTLEQGFIRNLPVLIALIVICLIGWNGSDVFLTQNNLTNLFQRVAPIAVMATGTTVLMIAAEIDLSIGAVVSLVSIFVARAVGDNASTALVLVEAIAIGGGISLIVGVFVTQTQAPSFMVTLGGLSILTGISMGMTNGQGIVLTGFTAIGSAKVGPIPISVLILVGVDALAWLMLYRTSVGRSIFAVGGNTEAARLAGFPVQVIRVFAFCVNGALVGLGTAMLTSSVGSGGPDLGTDLELQVIAAVVIGGATLAGGRGSLLGSFLGVLLLGAIANVLNLVGAESYVGTIVFGAFIVLAVGLRSERIIALANHGREAVRSRFARASSER